MCIRDRYLDSSIVTEEAKRICDGIVRRFGQLLTMEQAEDVKDKIRAEDAAKFDMIKERDDYLKNLLGDSYCLGARIASTAAYKD